MSKVIVESVFEHQLMTFVLLSCTGGKSHCYVLERGQNKPAIGDKVVCPTCADTEKQVKAARRVALKEAYELMNDFFGKPATDLLDKLLEDSP